MRCPDPSLRGLDPWSAALRAGFHQNWVYFEGEAREKRLIFSGTKPTKAWLSFEVSFDTPYDAKSPTKNDLS